MEYVAVALGGGNLVLLGLVCYFYFRARADRADRDAALTRAAAAGDLAARLQATLNHQGAKAKEAYADAQAKATQVSNPGAAADFLRDSTAPDPGVQSPDPAGPTKDHVSTPPAARGPRFVPGFGR